MAQQVEVLLLDDLERLRGRETAATQTVEFGYKGKRYAIDLNDANAAKFDDKMKPYLQGASQQLPAAKRRSRTVASRTRSREIRAWARERGRQVSERGRIPAEVVEEYDAVH